ncbi:MAG: radical SAM protein [Vulcanimicrobiaceae bacterium]
MSRRLKTRGARVAAAAERAARVPRKPIGLAYADDRGRIYFDDAATPLADGGDVRVPRRDELIAAPPGTLPTMLPGRAPLLEDFTVPDRRVVLGALLPAGFTRLLLPAFRTGPNAPTLPLFGYTYACVVDDELYVAAMQTDAGDDWTPRSFAPGELETIVARRRERDPSNGVLAQLATCSLSYACFTAQNVFLERGEAALPVSPTCNARCIGCISEQDPGAGIPSPQTRVRDETSADELVRIALAHLEAVPDGIVSFGQGCEGEPLLRVTTIARAIAGIRARTAAGTININTNGSMPASLQTLVDAGLDAVRVSLNSFRPEVYGAYYRPIGYALDDVLTSVRVGVAGGLRVSLNLLTHPGVTDDVREVEAADAFLRGVPVTMVQTRTLNIDPDRYFAAVGRPETAPVGMRTALYRIAQAGVRVGNFTHAH